LLPVDRGRDRDEVTTQRKKEILILMIGGVCGWLAYDWSLRHE
jgi:hypothetical protein